MKDKRITSIDLWRFILTVAIALTYLNNYVWRGTKEHLIFTGGQVLSFFLFISGYFLMEHYKKNKSEKKEMASKQAWKYAGKKFSLLYPALLGGVALAFVVRNVIAGTKISQIFTVFMDSIWEFLGIAQIGAVGLAETTSGVLNITTGVSTLWNSPLWFISALIICSLILYYVVSKNEDFFAGIFAPVFIILTYGSVGLTEAGWDRTMVNAIGIPNGIARVMAGMCVGMLLYYAVNYFRKKKLSERTTFFFSILHIGLAMFLVYTIFKGITWNEFTHAIIILLFVFVLLVNKDYVAVLYNNSKVCAFLGRLSIYYYACFIAFVYLLPWLFPQMGYHASLIFNILFSFSWSFIMMYVDDYVITPIFRKTKKN